MSKTQQNPDRLQQLAQTINAMPENEFQRLLRSLLHSPADTLSLHDIISDTLINYGFPQHVKGYNYARIALTIMLTEPNSFNNKTIALYKCVADHARATLSNDIDCTYTSVERCLRSAIHHAFDASFLANGFAYSTSYSTPFQKTFPCAITKPPKNEEFLHGLADVIRRKYPHLVK